VTQAVQAMTAANVGSVLAGTAEKPEGIFTERDLARRVVAKGLDPVKTKISDVMTKQFVSIEASEPMTSVFKRLAQGEFRHLPITENGRIVGVASVTDLTSILKELAAHQEFLDSFAGEIGPAEG
jgi:signal-transduction protein with cAMP-binding, CBS, and nucleotidyltransferase domain